MRQALAFENINQLLGEMEKIDVRSVEGLAREFKNFTLDIKPEVVKNLAEIMRHNDPIYTRIKDDMIEKAYEEAMRENANENS